MSSAADLPAPRDRPRVGDAERDQAVSALQDHRAEGRLTADEFEERMEQALAAKTQADLEPLFTDLPDPKPWDSGPAGALLATGAPSVPAHRPGLSGQQIAGISSLAWGAAIVAGLATGTWWFMIIPIFIMPALLKIFGRQNEGPNPHGYGPGDEQPRRLP